jgi:hypothetical protein
MQEGNIMTATVTGRVIVPYYDNNAQYQHTTSRETILGGVVGTAGDDRATTATNTANITITNATVVNAATAPVTPKDNPDDTEVNNIYLRGRTSGTITMGGVCAASSGSSGTEIVFKNCEYDGGIAGIRIANTSSKEGYIGGFIGEVKQNTSFENCRANAGSIYIFNARGTTDPETVINAGGFVGKADSSVFDGLYSNCPITVDIGAFPTATTRVGGFAGFADGSVMSYCYARSDINVTTASGSPFAGGLIAETNSSCFVSNCYARGDVTVKSVGSYMFAGGLMGRFRGSGLISNSYALGNVSVERTSGNGTIFVGGMVGEFILTGYNVSSTDKNGIWKCFNKGNVDAKSSTSDILRVREGGMVGNMYTSNTNATTCYLGYNATLGGRVLYRGTEGTGDYIRHYGRLGPLDSRNDITAENNYGFDKMQNNRGGYNVAIPGSEGTNYSDFSNGTPNNGTSASDSELKTESFWTKSDGLAFDVNVWDFSNIAVRGYPALKGVGGQ